MSIRYLLVSLFILLPVYLADAAQPSRLLLAKSRATGEWYQRIAINITPNGIFAQSIADQFSVSIGDIEVITRPTPEPEDFEIMRLALNAGTLEGEGTILAPVIPPDDPEEFEIPIEDFGAGAAGALTVLAGQGLFVRIRKKKA